MKKSTGVICFSIRNPQSAIRNSAFTLIEIMVSIVLFSLVIASIYATWMLIMKSSQVGEMAAKKAQRQRIVMGTIESSLMCIQSFQASPQYYSFIVDNGNAPVLSFAARLPDGFPRNQKFQGFSLRRVTFTLEPDATGMNRANNLVMRQNPILMSLDDDEKNNPLVLARDVKAFSISCWDTNQADWVTEWDNTNSIPPMIRVGLVLGNDDNNNNNSYNANDNDQDRVILRAFSLPSTMMPTVVQMGAGGVGGAGRVGNPAGGLALPVPGR